MEPTSKIQPKVNWSLINLQDWEAELSKMIKVEFSKRGFDWDEVPPDMPFILFVRGLLEKQRKHFSEVIERAMKIGL